MFLGFFSFYGQIKSPWSKNGCEGEITPVWMIEKTKLKQNYFTVQLNLLLTPFFPQKSNQFNNCTYVIHNNLIVNKHYDNTLINLITLHKQY